MKIAISGCGITGTTVGYFLSRLGHDVTIFEQADFCGPVGAGIMLQPSGQAVLQNMGLLEELQACSADLVGMTANLVSGKRLVRLRYEDLENDLFAIGAHRGRLFQLLLDACRTQGVQIHNGCQVTGYQLQGSEQAYKVSIELQRDQVTQTQKGFDFLVVADGSRSRVRQQSGIKTRVIDYQFGALWMTCKADHDSHELLQFVDGTRKLVGILPIGNGETSFFWGLPVGEYDQLVRSDFASWKSEVTKTCPAAEKLLVNRHSFKDFIFARYRHVMMKKLYEKGVIFLGDAAHSTSPHLGQGANLALEDAHEFARALENTGEFDSACQFFQRSRLRKIRYYQRMTKLLSPFFQSEGWLLGKLRDLFLPWLPSTPFVRKQMLKTLCGLKSGWFR